MVRSAMEETMTRFRRVRLLLGLLLAATAVRAQETRATISGTLTDPSGAAIAGAQVSLTNVETASHASSLSNGLGQYRFLFLNPGKYRLTAEMTGFKTLVREGIELSTNQAA